MRGSLNIVDSFYPHAAELRSHFEERFVDPRATRPDRFIWDYWNVPGQYTQLRTPAYEFFPKEIYEKFHLYLLDWGRRNLGCHDVSPPWMSCYLDGHYQGMHSDYPHGPFAFVFSLSPKKLRFKGGETLLLKDEILSFWQNLDNLKAFEEQAVYKRIPSPFNRLTVFDPRVPHGVSRLEGAEDVLEGRLVLHGWFVQPRPWIDGPLSPRRFRQWTDGFQEELAPVFMNGRMVAHGMCSFRFEVLPSGKTRNARILANTVRLLAGTEGSITAEKAWNRRLEKQILAIVESSDFGKQKGLSVVTLPLVFESA
jgi:hypothetical protein